MKLAQISAKYIDQPFEKYGCLEFVYHFLVDLGFAVPDRAGQWSVDNYKTLVAADVRRAQQEMLRAFKTIGNPASARRHQLGDLLVIRQAAERVFYPAVYVGSNQAMASFIRHGVRVFRLDRRNRPVLARRFVREAC